MYGGTGSKPGQTLLPLLKPMPHRESTPQRIRAQPHGADEPLDAAQGSYRFKPAAGRYAEDNSEGDSANRSFGCVLWALPAFLFLALLIGSVPLYRWQHGNYVKKAKLAKVIYTLDPIKAALDAKYRDTGKPAVITTALTTANSGGPVTPDWAALGFDRLPGLSREVSSLRVMPQDDIVVELTGIGQGIDGTEVRAHARRNAKGSAWAYSCTSGEELVKHFLGC
jgi:hypothetical protein